MTATIERAERAHRVARWALETHEFKTGATCGCEPNRYIRCETASRFAEAFADAGRALDAARRQDPFYREGGE